jgi:ribosomal protein S3AE
MGQNYMNQTNRLWFEIFQIVKENCTGDYKGANPQDDVMERLLSARRGK